MPSHSAAFQVMIAEKMSSMTPQQEQENIEKDQKKQIVDSDLLRETAGAVADIYNHHLASKI